MEGRGLRKFVSSAKIPFFGGKFLYGCRGGCVALGSHGANRVVQLGTKP